MTNYQIIFAAMFDPDIVIQAYTQGYFPMAHPDEGNEIFGIYPKTGG